MKTGNKKQQASSEDKSTKTRLKTKNRIASESSMQAELKNKEHNGEQPAR